MGWNGRTAGKGRVYSWFVVCLVVVLWACFFVRSVCAEANFQTTTVSGLTNAYHIVSADFNNDTIPDLAVTQWSANQVTVLLGNGLGGFTTGATLATGVHPNFIATGNLNGSGGLDLAVTNGGGERDVTFFFNDGTGTSWTTSTLSLGNDADVSSVVAANFTPATDSNIDLFIVKDSGYVPIDYYEVWQGNGAGLFTKIASENTQLQPIFAATADFDGDTILDMVVANYTSNSITVLLGNGDGTFDESSESPVTVGTQPRAIAAGNLNGDAHIDLAVVNYGGNSVTILLGNGDGTFTSGVTINSSGGTSSGVIADFDGDGFNDIAVTRTSANAVSIFYGIGNGTFDATPTNVTVGSSPLFIVASDLDKDGKTDLAVTNLTSNDATILLNRTGACLAPPAEMVSWWSGDGHPFDLVGANNGTMMNDAVYATGRVGRAFSLDGVNDFVQVVSPVDLPVGSAPRTVDVWFKTPRDLTSSTESSIVQYGSAASSQMFGLITSGNAPGKFYFYGHSSNLWGSTTIQPNTWYHGAVTYDGTTVRLYVNGQLEGSASMSLNTVLDGNGLTIGYRPGGAHWEGLVDEVNVYDRALTLQEIAAIHNAGSAGMCRPCFTPPSGLVSWWTGDGSASDIIGGNDGTLQGGATFVSGKVGQTFSLDGVDDHVIIPHNASLNPVNITVQAWIKARNTGEYQIIIDKGHGSGHGWGWVAQIRPDDKIDFCYGNGNIDYSGACALSTSFLTDDDWHHVAGTLDGATIKIYIDGKLEDSSAYSGTPETNNQDVYVGAAWWGEPRFFSGLIDEAQIFSRALSAEEIAAIHGAGSAGVCVPPDTTPDQFTFIDQMSAALSALVESNQITVAGINASASVSITGGEYSINGGDYTSATGIVTNGQTVRVRQISSSSFSTTTNATLTIGGVSDTFSVTTIGPPQYTISFSSTGNGTIICNPATVVLGNNSVCTVTPAIGHLLKSLTDNGTDMTDAVSGNTYTIANVTSGHTVEAVFAPFTFTPGNGTMGTVLEISGPGFGIKKGKVYLEKDGIRYATKVGEWNAGGTTNVIRATVSKVPPAGSYKIVLVSKEVDETSAESTFEIMAPVVDSVSVAQVDKKRVATIQGDFFGYAKKPKVSMNNGIKDLSCKVISVAGTEVKCNPHKSVVTGPYTVKVIVGNVLKGERILNITVP